MLRRRIGLALAVALFASQVWAVDTKTTALTAATAATSDDLVYLVDDPGGVPASKKITVGNLAGALPAVGIVNGGTLGPAATTLGHTYVLRAYDNDTGPAWVSMMSFANGNTPTATLLGTWDFTGATVTLPAADFADNSVKDADIDWGSGANQVDTADLPALVVDAGDGTWSGLTISRTVATGSAAELFGQVMFVESDGELNAADADATSTMPGVCVLVVAGEGASKTCVVSGTVSETDWNWTPGAILYVGTDPATTTGLVATAPAGSGDQVQVVGVALSADTILVQPSLVLVAVP